MSIEIQQFLYSAEKMETRIGFDDDELIHKALGISIIKEQMLSVAKFGFRYVGDADGNSNDGSKAYTDLEKRWIFIGRNKPTDEALLSLTYEMTNAKNAKKLNKIFDEYSKDRLPDSSRAACYAKAVLRVESDAIYVRSRTAISLGKESLIKNQKYLDIVKSHGIHHKAAVKEIFSEMLKNGTVHNGQVKAFDHYVRQYTNFTVDN